MFYDTKLNNHKMKYNPFKACLVPRPVAWISSVNNQGIVNIAPYSYFNAVADIPPTIMFSSSNKSDGFDKDSVRNIEGTGEFVVNIASYCLRDKLNQSSSPLDHGISEAEVFAIETVSSIMVKPPRIKQAAISFECKHLKTIALEDAKTKIILGSVVGIYIDDEIITDGKVDIIKLRPLARLGYNEYTFIEKTFTMDRPK